MQNFISHQNIVSNEMSRDKSTLSRGDNIWEDLFQPVRHDFGYNFINNIAQTNRPEIRHFLR